MKQNRVTVRKFLTEVGAWEDFHSLTSSVKKRLEAEADRVGYRKPYQANGSRLRYFHAHLIRTKDFARRQNENEKTRSTG